MCIIIGYCHLKLSEKPWLFGCSFICDVKYILADKMVESGSVRRTYLNTGHRAQVGTRLWVGGGMDRR